MAIKKSSVRLNGLRSINQRNKTSASVGTMNTQKSTVYLDIETNSNASRIWCCCTLEEGAEDVLVWTDAEAFNRYIAGAGAVVAHNGIGFDYKHLIHHWGWDSSSIKLVDTLVLSRLANPVREGGHSLKNWGAKLGYPKDEFSDWDAGLTEEMISYCKQDVRVLQRVFHTLKAELEGFSKEAINLEHRVAHIIQEQVDNGFKINMPLLTSYVAELSDRILLLEKQLQDTFEPTIIELKTKTKIIPFNPGSRQQIADRLMKRGWKPQLKTDKGNVIVDEDVLSKIDTPESKQLQEYLLVQKRLAQAKSWLEAVGDDERIHGSVITIGAVTGRMAHNKPNLGQVPAVRSPYGGVSRSVFTVDTDKVLVGCDLSGIELRCFAHYLNDADYIDEIVNGDVHTRNQQLFGVATRDLAKTVLYAGLYGASPSKLAAIVGGTAKDGAKLRDGFSKIPGYTALVTKVDRLSSKGWLPGLDGRRLVVRSQHAALNLLLQGAGAIVFKQWLVVQKNYLTKAGIHYKLVASVHDEVQVETDKENADEVGSILVKAAKDAGIMLGFRCPVAAEYKYGVNWKDTH